MKLFKTLSIVAIGAALSLTSCKKDEAPSPNSSSQAGDQSFKVRMTDNPGNYSALDVEIVSISAMNSNNEWVELNNSTQTVSVLELTNGKETTLAFKNNVDAGVYTKLKIKFSQNNRLTLNSFLSGGSSSSIINVGVNVGSTTDINEEVIIEIDESISSTTNADVLIDFNVAESVIENSGNYMIDPVITVISDAQTGVKGEIENDTRAALKFEMSTNTEMSYTAYTDDEGNFMVRGMADGDYNLTVMPDQDEDNSLNSSYSFSNITVVDGQITNLGEFDLQ